MHEEPQQRMPVVFVSHGAPTLATEDNDAHRFLRTFGIELGRPRGILVVSAHFEAPVATVTAAESPQTIHDFGGFPRELYEMTYPAPGSPELAGEVLELLAQAGVPTRAAASRGLDHGAWIPLSLMYPQADIPVVQVSIDPRRGSRYHHELGRHLAPLRGDGVLIMGSGGVTHNLRELAWDGRHAGTPQWAAAFNEWVAEATAAGRIDDLLAYRDLAPHAARNHPTEEHFFPLLCALGAVSEDEHRARVHHSYTMGALSMDTYQFGNCPGQTQ
jgi:4,5-DOPA dioxygenase extradiol